MSMRNDSEDFWQIVTAIAMIITAVTMVAQLIIRIATG